MPDNMFQIVKEISINSLRPCFALLPKYPSKQPACASFIHYAPRQANLGLPFFTLEAVQESCAVEDHVVLVVGEVNPVASVVDCVSSRLLKDRTDPLQILRGHKLDEGCT